MHKNHIISKKDYAVRRMAQKTEAALRLGLVHVLSGSLPYYVVNEYPKSGGSWIGQMLGEALEVPFPRNRMPVLRPSIMHGHYLHQAGLRNLLVVWRDPRDLMISFYYHSYFVNERANGTLVRKMKQALPFQDYDDLSGNLPRFLERMLTDPVSPHFAWQKFAQQWAESSRACHVTYEDMRANPIESLDRICRELAGVELDKSRLAEIVDKYSFEKQSGRKPGEASNNSFVRKGVVGDWKNHFSREAAEILEHYAGRELKLLGYEANSSWVARCK